MHPEFWHQRWNDNQIGFHEAVVNPLLVTHLEALALPRNARLFLPLCGKTLDIDWLLSRGYRVAGAELSSLAVAQLFARLGIEAIVERQDGIERHGAPGLDIFVGDIFHLPGPMLGAVDAVYDRAALIALPPDMRPRYARHLALISRSAPQLLITLEYDQTVVDGPPFSVPAAEVGEHFSDRVPQLLASDFQPLGLKGRYPVTQRVWKIP